MRERGCQEGRSVLLPGGDWKRQVVCRSSRRRRAVGASGAQLAWFPKREQLTVLCESVT